MTHKMSTSLLKSSTANTSFMEYFKLFKGTAKLVYVIFWPSRNVMEEIEAGINHYLSILAFRILKIK